MFNSLLVFFFIVVPLSSSFAQTYQWTDKDGSMHFSDSPPTSTDTGKPDVRLRYKKPVNETPMPDFNKIEQQVIQSLGHVLDVYCRGDLKDYKMMSLPEVRSRIDRSIQETGAKTVSKQMRGDCYPYFKVTKMKFGMGIPELNLKLKTATVSFESVEPSESSDNSSPTFIDAEFALKNKEWKFLGFVSTSNYDPQSQKPIEEPLTRRMDVTGDDLKRQQKRLIAAAEHGNGKAAMELYQDYYGGYDGFPRDIPEAMKWLRTSAEANQPESQRALGHFLYYGDGVLPVNHPEGMLWLKRAAANGDESAKELINKIESGEGLFKRIR